MNQKRGTKRPLWSGRQVKVLHLSVARRSANSMSMNPRHAAALALVGWYLMTPNPISDPKLSGYPNLAAHLYEWQIYESFDTAKACQAEKEKLTDKWMPEVNQSKTKQQKEKAFLWMTSPVCIATDDPRLKENVG